jgi:type VI secretion system protein ImpH
MNWQAALAERPYAFDFYQALRRFDALHRGLPRLGDGMRPAEEAVRLGQEPSLTFAPANLSGFTQGAYGPPRLSCRFLGLFGPQGALPTHLTELARERLRNHGDPSLARFADLFHHRLLSAFYKAWRQAQPAACHDRPESDRFAMYLDSLTGTLPGDSVPALAKRYFAGHLVGRTRPAGGLEAILSEYFGLPVDLQPFHARWMYLPADQRSVLGARNGVHGAAGNVLGHSLVLGSRVWDAQHHFLLRIGPMSMAQYVRMLPAASGARQLRDWVRLYTDRQFGWRARLVLRREDVPPLQLGRSCRLGWTSWLAPSPSATAVDGYVLDGEAPVPQAAAGDDAQGTTSNGSHDTPGQSRIRITPEEETCLK